MSLNLEKMVLLDLFSGIGGFHLGLERAGFQFQTVYNSEIDKYARSVYERQFPEAEWVGSVTDVRGADLQRPNIITFGSPCQDFSVAGRRDGMGGERSSLIREAIRLIAECRPDIFVWENVKGTFSSNSGEDFWAIIKAFTDIGGYRLEWQLVNTTWVLPQNRERIYLVGYLGDTCRREIFPLRYSGAESDQRNAAESPARSLQHPGHSGGNYRGMNMVQVGNVDQAGNNSIWGRVYDPDGCSATINSEGGGMGAKTGLYQVAEIIEDFYPDRIRRYKDVAPALRADRSGLKVSHGETDEFTPMQWRRTEKGRKIRQEEMAKGKDYTPFSDGCRELVQNPGKEVGSLTAHAISKDSLIGNRTRIRRLTPRECERLQGFPDDWTRLDNEGKEISDTQRYKMTGNAVTVDIVKLVGNSILEAING